MILSCSDCGKQITKQSKTGRCPACALARSNADPTVRARRREGIRAKFQEPEHRAKIVATIRRNHDKALARPEYMEWLRENGRKRVASMFAPEARAKYFASRADVGKKITEARLGWCPPEYRDQYRVLTISKRMLAHDARAEIERRIARDERAKLAAIGLSDAVRFLRRYTPVSQRGDAWLYGNAELTTDELMQRALSKGWQPERWAA